MVNRIAQTRIRQSFAKLRCHPATQKKTTTSGWRKNNPRKRFQRDVWSVDLFGRSFGKNYLLTPKYLVIILNLFSLTRWPLIPSEGPDSSPRPTHRRRPRVCTFSRIGTETKHIHDREIHGHTIRMIKQCFYRVRVTHVHKLIWQWATHT